MNLSDRGVALIASFEGFRSSPYRDAVGVWTIGYGSTDGVGPNTPPVTEEQALARLKTEVASSYGNAVNNLNLPLTQNQFDALCSFTYNVGVGGISYTTTVGRNLRARAWAAAADALLAWNKAGGQVLPGLVRRRQAERALFLEPDSTERPPAGSAPPFPWGHLDYIGAPRPDPHCHSGHYGPPDSDHVRTWQQRMLERGWRIVVDGDYGPASERACRAFQGEKGLGVDGLVGPATWAAAWTTPVT